MYSFIYYYFFVSGNIRTPGKTKLTGFPITCHQAVLFPGVSFPIVLTLSVLLYL